MNKDRSVYIRFIYDCICRIEAYTQDGREGFLRDMKTQDAVIRNIEVIGQAVKDFGVDELITGHSDIPWDKITGMRNILAHQYLGVDMQLTWEVVANHLPQLKSTIMNIAKAMDIALRGVDGNPESGIESQERDGK